MGMNLCISKILLMLPKQVGFHERQLRQRKEKGSPANSEVLLGTGIVDGAACQC